MNAVPDTKLLARLHVKLLSYQTSHFILYDDLVELYQVSQVGAPLSTILYSSRIMEALAVDTLGDLATSIVYSNLEALQRFNLAGGPDRYWLHSLRRMGNDVRHILRRVEKNEADIALMFTERCLEWFFAPILFPAACLSSQPSASPWVCVAILHRDPL